MDYLRPKKDGRWVVRVVVPERLQAIVGQKQFERSVGRDPRIAQKRAYPLIADFQRQIARAERQLELQGGDSPARSRRAFSMSEIAHTHYGEELALDDFERSISTEYQPHRDDIDPLGIDLGDFDWNAWNVRRRNVLVPLLRRIAAGRATIEEIAVGIGWAIDKFAERDGCKFEAGSSEWRSRARQLAMVQLEALQREEERDSGNFAGRPALPILQEPIEVQEPEPEPLKLQDLFDAHFRELDIQGAGAEAKRRWQPVFDDLRAFLKHSDARRITPEKLDEWKENLMARLKPKTIKDVYFAAVRAVLRSAVKARKLPSNPAADLTIKVAKPKLPREKGFNDDEAVAVLKAATAYRSKPSDNPSNREHPKTEAAKRWAPWLCAYTGARIAEMTQLRGEDVTTKDGIHYLRITSDAGSVKSGQYRDVPLHPHLIELGFLDFVKTSGSEPLFYKSIPDRTTEHPWHSVARRVSDWIRDLKIVDPRVAPNHGWRHRFKTVAVEVGMNSRVVDAIQGHASRTAGENYGDVTLKARKIAVDLLPAYHLD